MYNISKNKIRHLYDIHFLIQKEEIESFIKSENFKTMLTNVREDDANQFSQEWAKVELHKTAIFSDTKNVIESIKSYYKTNFIDLVYGSNLPTIKEIELSIGKLLYFLK